MGCGQSTGIDIELEPPWINNEEKDGTFFDAHLPTQTQTSMIRAEAKVVTKIPHGLNDNHVSLRLKWTRITWMGWTSATVEILG